MPSDPASGPSRPAVGDPRWASGWLAASAFAPGLMAAAQLDLDGNGGRDPEAVRSVGLGYTGGLRALDAWLAAPFAELPLGTRILRAELPGLFLLAATGTLLYLLIRGAIASVAGPSRWAPVVALIASLTATFSFPAQHEATSPGSGVAGLVLVLAMLVVLASDGPPRALLPALSGLSLTYDPAVGACAVLACVVSLVARQRRPAAPRMPPAVAIAWGTVAALVPFVLAVIHARVSLLTTGARLFASGAGVASVAAPVSFLVGARRVASALRHELGEVLLLLALAGLVWSLASSRGRRTAAAPAAVTVAAAVAWALSEMRGAGHDMWSPASLTAMAGLVVFAGVTMHEGIVRVARARLPLAAGSAAMVVLLEAAFPAILLDDGLARRLSGRPLGLSTWEDTAFDGLPGGALVLVAAPRLYVRLLATEAAGRLPADLQLVPTFDASNEAAASALAHDAKLVPLFRDLVLAGSPAELSLSTLATTRPLAFAADPRWERTLSRHLIPTGLLAVFEPEPRGGADRKRALDATATGRARLAAVIAPEPRVEEPPPLAGLTAAVLLDRAIGAIQTGEREVALRALDDAARFAPKDARITKLMVTVTSAKGPVDVHELARGGLAGEAP